MSLRLKIARHLDVTVMEFSGRVTLGEGSVVFREAVREALWNGQRKLALDYGDINYQDSSGNGELVGAFTIARNSGAELVLFDLTKKVHDLLQVTRLYTVFTVFDSRESALAHFDATRKPEIRISENRFLDLSVLNIEGALTGKSGAQKVVEATQKSLLSGAKSVILLCPQVLDIDRTGADNLLTAMQSVRARGGQLVLAGVEQRLLPAMSETNVIPEVPAYETIDAALKAFGLVAKRGFKYEVVRVP
jgi:anti-sigma B factor antagonist